MAKNHSGSGGILTPPTKSSWITEGRKTIVRRPKYVAWSILIILCITLLSYMIPDKYYTEDMNLFFLNLELLIVFGRDILTFYSRSCKILKSILILMTSIYIINLIDLILDLPYIIYLYGSISIIVLCLTVIYLIGKECIE